MADTSKPKRKYTKKKRDTVPAGENRIAVAFSDVDKDFKAISAAFAPLNDRLVKVQGLRDDIRAEGNQATSVTGEIADVFWDRFIAKPEYWDDENERVMPHVVAYMSEVGDVKATGKQAQQKFTQIMKFHLGYYRGGSKWTRRDGVAPMKPADRATVSRLANLIAAVRGLYKGMRPTEAIAAHDGGINALLNDWRATASQARGRSNREFPKATVKLLADEPTIEKCLIAAQFNSEAKSAIEAFMKVAVKVAWLHETLADFIHDNKDEIEKTVVMRRSANRPSPDYYTEGTPVGQSSSSRSPYAPDFEVPLTDPVPTPAQVLEASRPGRAGNVEDQNEERDEEENEGV